MKKLIGLLIVISYWAGCAVFITKCGYFSDEQNPEWVDPTAPKPPKPTPTPPVPPPPAHYRGFIKKPGYGLHPGAPNLLADRIGELPVKFSWVDAGFGIPVRNQGPCGSCYSFSSTLNLEFAAKIFLGKDERLSTQQLVSCDDSSYGCSGGWFGGDYMVANGIALESDFPYTATNKKCKQGLKPAEKPISFVNIGDGTNSPTVKQLKQALLQYGPLSVDMDAWELDNYDSKPLSGNGHNIDHMVILVSWNDAEGAWTAMNSWGNDFGDHGYFKIKYGADSFAQDASTVLVKPVGDYTGWTETN